jgi:hypothetical protein
MINDDEMATLAKKILNEISIEYSRACISHTAFPTMHHGYAVIKEELDELWDEIKLNPNKMSDVNRKLWKQDVKREAIQISAMALRFVIDLCKEP